jgi:hypothetical protein
MSKFDNFLVKALPAFNAKRTAADLGDRTKYVGASDIASCARKAVMSRLNPKPFTIQELLRFERGHAAEAIFANIFESANTSVARKIEVTHPDEPGILVHPDFVFYSPRRKYVHVVEFKSTSGIPDKPYGSWVDQLHVQMGTIKAHLETHGELHLIIRGETVVIPYDVVIGGSVVAIDINEGTYHEFNSFEPNEIVFDHLFKKGLKILSAIHGGPIPEGEPSPLCSCCKYRNECPSHAQYGAGDIADEIMDAVIAFDNFQAVRNRLDVHISDLREVILANCRKGRFTAITADLQQLEVLATPVVESTYIDEFRLITRYPEVYKDCIRKKKAHTRLMVKVEKLHQVPLNLKVA